MNTPTLIGLTPPELYTLRIIYGGMAEVMPPTQKMISELLKKGLIADPKDIGGELFLSAKGLEKVRLMT
jgi:hypothetical protein